MRAACRIDQETLAAFLVEQTSLYHRAEIRLLQRGSIPPVHTHPGRPVPADLAALYTIDEPLTSPPPRALGLFDDILTTGAHFKAAQQVLLARFPGTPVAGIFLARTPHTWQRTGGTECRTLSSWVRR